jgi:glycosyltransferase involved in cell wall biosynthesis
MAKPTVSIITAAWTRAQYIGIGIQSAIDQTFQDWELIIADDGSPDNTAQVVAEWQKKDKRIKYLRLEHVGRIAVVSNAALREAQGEFVAVLDDDDYWIDKRKLEKQVAFLRAHPDYIACGGWFVAVDENGVEKDRLKKPETDEGIRRVMLSANGIANSTSMFRRVGRAGQPERYDETMPQFADWDFFLRLGTKGKLHNFSEYFLAYRMWNKGSSFTNQHANAQAAVAIVKRYRNDYPGYAKAMFLAQTYLAYSYLPLFVRQGLNAFLSRLKKTIFSR